VRGRAPARPTRPYVGLRPTTPQQAAGSRIEPPVSLPRAPTTKPAATAAAEPLEEPPAAWPRFHGFWTSPWWGLSPKGPSASSVMLSLPSVTAPASPRRPPALHSRVTATGDTGRAVIARERVASRQSATVLARLTDDRVVLQGGDEARRLLGERELPREPRDGGGEVGGGRRRAIGVAHACARGE